ncbi:MAG: tetratricopeptide repeat protein, partial [Verrucomicrobiota bacterium]
EQSLAESPDEPRAHIALSEFLAAYYSNELEGRDRAVEVIERALRQFPAEPEVYEQLVKLYLISKRRDEALDTMRASLLRKNTDPQFWLAMGRIAAPLWPNRNTSEDPFPLDRFYEKALEQGGSDLAVKERVADYYHATQQYELAEELYREVIAARPDQLAVRRKLARVYGGLGDEVKVLEVLKEILEIDSQNVVVHRQIAAIYLRSGNAADAIPYLRDALTISKGTEREYAELGEMMMRSEDYEAAAEFLEESAYLFPEAPLFPFFLTGAYGRLQQWEKSLPHFRKTEELAREKQPELLDQRFYFRYAAAEERTGNFDFAEELFQKTIGLIEQNDPENIDSEFTATVYNYLGYMWLENGENIEPAGELIKVAFDLNPESGAIADSLGWYYFLTEDYEAARDTLLQAEILLEEPDPVIYDHIAQVYEKLEEFDKAIEYFEKALELEGVEEGVADRLEAVRKKMSETVGGSESPANPPAAEALDRSADAQ